MACSEREEREGAYELIDWTQARMLLACVACVPTPIQQHPTREPRSRHHEEHQLTFPPMSTRPSPTSSFLLRTQTPTRASPPSPSPFPSRVPSHALLHQPPVPRAPTTTRSSLALAPTADSFLPSMTPPTAASSASVHANALRCLAGDTISTTGGAQP